MRRLISYNVFEGDPDLIAEGQILRVLGQLKDIQLLGLYQRQGL